MKKRCGNCAFAETASDDAGLDPGQALCRRHPPVVDPPDDQGFRDGVWPLVSAEGDWCGEWVAE